MLATPRRLLALWAGSAIRTRAPPSSLPSLSFPLRVHLEPWMASVPQPGHTTQRLLSTSWSRTTAAMEKGDIAATAKRQARQQRKRALRMQNEASRPDQKKPHSRTGPAKKNRSARPSFSTTKDAQGFGPKGPKFEGKRGADMEKVQERKKQREEAKKALYGGSVPFSHLPLSSALLRNLGLMRFSQSTTVQRNAFRPIARGKNVAVNGQTGCGKTLAYLLPLVNRAVNLQASASGQENDGTDDTADDKRPAPSTPRTIVLAPTRQLARSIFTQLEALTKDTPVRIAGIIGDGKGQTKGFLLHPRLTTDILVTVPGRLQRLIDEHVVSMPHIQTLVIDEADYFFEEFQEEILPILARADPVILQKYCTDLPAEERELLAEIPEVSFALGDDMQGKSPHGHTTQPKNERGTSERERISARKQPLQFVSVGATLNTRRTQRFLEALDCQNVYDLPMGESDGKRALPVNIRHEFHKVHGPNPKPNALLALCKDLEEGASRTKRRQRAAVFCNRTSTASYVSQLLRENGHRVLAFVGGMSKQTKEATLDVLDNVEDSVFLVCTDGLTRGMNLNMDTVVNFELPPTARDYVHRSGRCGRMGQQGWVHSIIGRSERERAHLLQSRIVRGEDLTDTYGDSGSSTKKTGRSTANGGRWYTPRKEGTPANW